jgi:hypothetical protein
MTDANGWRPISTAPRDGTRVLLWCPATQWRGVAAWDVNPYEGHQMAWTTDETESVLLTYDAPTMWQPLPPPPGEGSDG